MQPLFRRNLPPLVRSPRSSKSPALTANEVASVLRNESNLATPNSVKTRITKSSRPPSPQGDQAAFKQQKTLQMTLKERIEATKRTLAKVTAPASPLRKFEIVRQCGFSRRGSLGAGSRPSSALGTPRSQRSCSPHHSHILSGMKLDLSKVQISKEEPILVREIHDENQNPNGAQEVKHSPLFNVKPYASMYPRVHNEHESLLETDRDHNPMSSPSSLSQIPIREENSTLPFQHTAKQIQDFSITSTKQVMEAEPPIRSDRLQIKILKEQEEAEDISRIIANQEQTAPFDQSNIMYFESINKAVPQEAVVKKEPLKQMEGSRDSDFFFKSGYVIKEKEELSALCQELEKKEEQQQYKFQKLISFTPQSIKVKPTVAPQESSIPDQSVQTTPFTKRMNQTPLSITHLRQSSIEQQSEVIPLSTHPEMMLVKTAEERKLEEMERSMSLEQRVFYKQAWHVRKRAYIEVGNLLRMKAPLLHTPLSTSQIGGSAGIDQQSFAMYNDQGESLIRQQGVIGGWLKMMILDNNTACQFEALKSTLSFFENVEDHELMRQTASTLLPLILDKVGVMRTQTAELIKQMLVQLIDTHILTVFPQLVSRLDSKNQKLVLFCVNLLCAILEEKGEVLGEVQIQALYKASIGLLKSSNRTTRVLGNSLLAGVYSQVLDPLDSFLENGLHDCRVAQKKELIDILQHTQKIRAKFYLFEGQKQSHKGGRMNSGIYEDLASRITPSKMRVQGLESTSSNLMEIVHPDFKDIRLVRDFKTKLHILQDSSAKLKNAAEQVNLKLEDSQKGAALILNNLINLLDDKQQLILQETLSLLISFAKIAGVHHLGIASSKLKTLLTKLFERCKETKKAVVNQLRDTLFQLLASRILPVQMYIELAFHSASKNKNFRVRALPFEFFALLLEAKHRYDQRGTIQSSKQKEEYLHLSSSEERLFFEEVLEYSRIVELLSIAFADQLSKMANNDSSGYVRDAAISVITAGKQLHLEKEAFDGLLDSLSKQRVQDICKKLHLKAISIGSQKVIFLPLITVQKNSTPAKESGQDGSRYSSAKGKVQSSQPGHLPGIAEPLLKSIQETLNSMEFQLSQEESQKQKEKVFMESMLQERAEQFEREGIRLLELQKAEATDSSITFCLLSTLNKRAQHNVYSASLILHTFSYFLPAVQIAVTGSSASHISTTLFQILLHCANKSSAKPHLLPVALLDSSITSLYNHLNSNQLFFSHLEGELRNMCENASPTQVLATMGILFNWIKLRIKGLINNGAPPQALASLAQILKAQNDDKIRPHIEAIYSSFQEKFKTKLTQLGLPIPDETSSILKTQQESQIEDSSYSQPKKESTVPRIFLDLREVMLDMQGSSNEQRKRALIGLSQIISSAEIKLLQEKQHSLILTSLCHMMSELTDSATTNLQHQLVDILSSYPQILEHFGIDFTVANLGVVISSVAQKLIANMKLSAKQQLSVKSTYYALMAQWIKHLSLTQVCQAIKIAFGEHVQLTSTLGFKYLREILKWLVEKLLSSENRFSIYELEPTIPVLVKGLGNMITRAESQVIIEKVISLSNKEETIKFFEIHLIDSNALYRIFSDWLDQRSRRSITPLKATFAPKVVMPSPNNKALQESKSSIPTSGAFLSPNAGKEISRIEESEAPSPEEKKEYDNFEVNQLLQSIRTPRGEEVKIAENVNKQSQRFEKEEIREVACEESKEGEDVYVEKNSLEMHYERAMKKLQMMMNQPKPKPEESYHSKRYSVASSPDASEMMDQSTVSEKKEVVGMKIESLYGFQEEKKAKIEKLEERTHFEESERGQEREEDQRINDAIRLQGHRAKEVEVTLQKLLKEEREKHRQTIEDLKLANDCYFKEMSQKMELQMQLDAERKTKQNQRIVKAPSPLKTSMSSLQEEALQVGVKHVKSPEFGKQSSNEDEFQPLSLNDLSDDNIQEQLTTTTARKIESLQRGLLKEKTPAKYSEIPEEESREYEIRSPTPPFEGRKSFRARSLSNASFLVNKSLVRGIRGFAEDDELNNSVSEWTERRERRNRSVSSEREFNKSRDKFIEGVFKIQDVLLRSGDAKEELEKPLMFMYSRLRGQHQKVKLLQGLVEAMSNEDVLYALKDGQFKCLIGVVLSIYSKEKDLLMQEQINRSRHVFDTSGMSQPTGENEVSKKSQQLLSLILNSKQFTNSLCTLIQLISEKMPSNFQDPLSNETKIFVRVSLRCITQILKELANDENPAECVRVFEVLFSLNQLFITHPPQSLSERLPSINELNFIYQSLKQVTDTLLKIHPEKAVTFVSFIEQRNSSKGQSVVKSTRGAQSSAFVNYLKALQPKK